MSLTEDLTRRFYAWEWRGRGWLAFPHQVVLEPPFLPFPGHALPPRRRVDDARRETWASVFADSFFGKQAPGGREEAPALPIEDEEEPEPEPFGEEEDARLVEIEVVVPPGLRVHPGTTEAFLLATSYARYPVSFEIVGLPEGISLHLTLREHDRALVTHQLRAFFPEALPRERERSLGEMWRGTAGHSEIVECGLAREFMLPLATHRDFSQDPLTSLLGALSGIEEGEAGLFQVMWAPVRNLWAESVLRAVHDRKGEPFFADAPELTALAREKVSRPLYAAVVRLGAKSREYARVWAILEGLVAGLIPFGAPSGNDLVPLSDEGEIDLEADLLTRRTHRSGMLLSASELASLVHPPHETVRLPKLRREVRRTKAAPPLTQGHGVLLGTNVHEGRTLEVRLPRDLRMRHVHVVGASGSGKSTLLTQMILEDLESGEGVGVLDPHGDLVDEILARFPKEREDDLVLFDPADEGVALGWNMLQAQSEIEKTLLSSDLVGVFRRLSTSWGDQMNSVLANAILAFLESETGGTLLDLRRFLVDREFRAEFLRTVHDPEVLYYWQKEFPLLVGKPQGPILTRLDTFLRPKLVRRVVVERENRLDFRGMVDQGQVFLAKLAQGALGEENAALLGSLLVSAFHQAAISRQDLAPGARREFYLYLDEFHELATPSMAALLTGARKYRLGLTLAHQELRQLEAKNREVASALLGNAATRIVFRVGENDARDLERGFSAFAAADLVNLGVGEAVGRVERSEFDFTLKTAPLPRLDPQGASNRREHLVALTRDRFPRGAEEEAPRREYGRAKPEVAPIAPPPPPRPRIPPPQVPAPQLGRGGPEHKYLQELVKRWAESKGFRAVVEEEIPGGRVDVALEQDGWRIACEISVTTTPEQELGNIEKCLGAGFDHVALISTKKGHLGKIQNRVLAVLPASTHERLSFLTPEELFSFLEGRTIPTPGETTIGGYRVKVNYRRPTQPDADARTRTVSEVILKSLRKLKEEER